MPKVLEIGGYKIYIFTGDHLPRHVHVTSAEMKCKISLETLDVTDWNRSATQRFTAKAQELVEANQDFLISEWDRIGPVT